MPPSDHVIFRTKGVTAFMVCIDWMHTMCCKGVTAMCLSGVLWSIVYDSGLPNTPALTLRRVWSRIVELYKA